MPPLPFLKFLLSVARCLPLWSSLSKKKTRAQLPPIQVQKPPPPPQIQGPTSSPSIHICHCLPSSFRIHHQCSELRPRQASPMLTPTFSFWTHYHPQLGTRRARAFSPVLPSNLPSPLVLRIFNSRALALPQPTRTLCASTRRWCPCIENELAACSPYL